MTDMAEDGKFLCNFTILDRKFTYRVFPEEEAMMRNAVRNISDKLAELRQRHSFRDNQDALTVVLIQFAVLLEKTRMDVNVANHVRMLLLRIMLFFTDMVVL